MDDFLERLKTALAAAAKHDTMSPPTYDAKRMLSPWAAWCLICLVRMLEMRDYVRDFAERRIPGLEPVEETTDKAAGDFQTVLGIVPGAPAWEYQLFRNHFTLRNRLTNGLLAFWRDASKPFRFTAAVFIDALRFRERGFPEERLNALHPRTESIGVSLSDLAELGILNKTGSEFECKFDHRPLLEVITQLNVDAPDNALLRKSVASAIGDWQYLTEQGDTNAQQQWTDLVTIRIRRSMLLRDYMEDEQVVGLLAALWELNAPELIDVLHAELQITLYEGIELDTKFLEMAVAITGDTQSPALLTDIWDLATKLALDEYYNAEFWADAMDVLLGSKTHRERALEQIENAHDDVLDLAAILSLKHCPEKSRRLFDQALRSENQWRPTRVSAALGLLREPWAWKLLASALQRTGDHTFSAPIRTALWESLDPTLRAEVTKWEADHREGSLSASTRASVDHAQETTLSLMSDMHDSMIKLRGRVVQSVAS